MDTRLYLDPGLEEDDIRFDGSPGTRRWVSAGELADLLGCSVWSVRRAVRAGRLRTREVLPGLIRIDLRSVPAGRHSCDRRAG